MSYLVHPWLLVAGLFAVALPVLIHLLNRRRFRVVDWAAMDFLLQADKQSRRRIRLQHWLLLFLRSLAVALVGLLVARPLLQSNLTSQFAPAEEFERIIVLDDSLSMQARCGNESAWEVAKRTTLDLLQRLAAQRGRKETLTLLVASKISQPFIARTAITNTHTDEWKSRLDELDCGNAAVDLAEVLHQLAESLRSQDPGVNRTVYLLTDLRQPDWQESGLGADASAAQTGPVALLNKLSDFVQGCYVVDVADEHDGNLTVAQVQPDGAMVSDVRTALDVTVLNQGSTDAQYIRVQLVVGDGLPATEKIQRIAPGESSTVRFQTTLSCDSAQIQNDKHVERTVPRRLRVELQPENTMSDLLPNDSVFYFPATTRCGIRALLVDGDQGAESEKSESFYLRRALAPAGPAKTGILCEVVGEDDLDSQQFTDVDVVFLLNNSRLGSQSTENLKRLGQWVEAGGNLVLMPGDQTDAQWFRSALWQNGRGLSPLKLLAATPNEDATKWVGLQFVENNSLLPRLAGESAFVENVKVFRYWRAEGGNDDAAASVRVIAHLNDDSNTPAIMEKSWGEGHVVAFAIPADADWHNWPANPSYLLMVQDLVHALVRDTSDKGLLHVGDMIHQFIDLGQFEIDAVVEDPGGSKTPVQAAPPESRQADSARWQFVQPVGKQLGFYSLSLSRRAGGQKEVLFAANADRKEGDLKRADLAALKRAVAGSSVRFVAADDVSSLTGNDGHSELWRYVAWLLVAVLASEQALGWFFGRERT